MPTPKRAHASHTGATAVLLVSLTVCLGCAEETPDSLLPGDGSLPADSSTPIFDASVADGAADAGLLDAAVNVEGDADADAALHDSGDGAAAPEQRFTSKPLATPPTYRGSLNNGAACSTNYATAGFAPDGAAGARYPLFLYFVGTSFVASDVSARHDNMAALKVAEAMARRGYVALSAAYDNSALAWLSDHKNQLACLFGADNAQGLLATACALPEVDCSLGIALWGHSQGGYVAHAAFDRDPRVRGVWATGYGGDANAGLSKHRLRVVNGETDTQNGMAATLNGITGLTPAECTEPDQCLRTDGSGWIIVRARDLLTPGATADHCWFDRSSCSASTLVLDPSWVDPASDKPFALESNADWLARTARDAQLP